MVKSFGLFRKKNVGQKYTPPGSNLREKSRSVGMERDVKTRPILKVFILPRVAELFIHKEKQRGCPLLGCK